MIIIAGHPAQGGGKIAGHPAQGGINNENRLLACSQSLFFVCLSLTGHSPVLPATFQRNKNSRKFETLDYFNVF